MILESWKFGSWREFLGRYRWWSKVKAILQPHSLLYYKTKLSLYLSCIDAYWQGIERWKLLGNLILAGLAAYISVVIWKCVVLLGITDHWYARVTQISCLPRTRSGISRKSNRQGQRDSPLFFEEGNRKVFHVLFLILS